MLTNPYNPYRVQQSENHSLHARVGQEDFYFLKQKFPYYPGLIDKVVSNLFKKVIDELRRRDSETHINTALYIDDPSYRILDDVIAGFTCMERRTVGEHSLDGQEDGGRAAPQHESGSVDRVHPEMQRSPEQQPDTKGRTKTRVRRSKGTKEKEIQR